MKEKTKINDRATKAKALTRGLPQDRREQIKSRRQELGISLRDLSQRVGVGAPQLARIEQGEMPATPPLQLRILAELGFGPDEFDEILNDSPQAWLARKIAISTSDPKQLGSIIRKGRMFAKISIEDLATATHISVARLHDMEIGYLKISPALLVDLVRAWDLPPALFHELIPQRTNFDWDFAEQFIASLLERSGFHASKSEGSRTVSVNIGGEWSLKFSAKLIRNNNKYGKKI